jgi:hypothetical protein
MMEGKTRLGQRVVGLKVVPYNDAGRKVTYPIKGSIVRKEKPLKLEYTIWSAEGICDVVFGTRSGDDLIEGLEGI